jgi:RNA-directed DNA polymerase
MIAVSPEQRLNLTEEIKGTLKAKPLRRVWIPKPGRDEKRPLGIPTIKDRARQALIKSALEPEWESKMEGTSYGFRPGRSAHDAISRIYLSINKSSYWLFGLCYAMDGDYKGWNPYIERHLAIFVNCFLSRAN